jgi:hypothetical protein
MTRVTQTRVLTACVVVLAVALILVWSSGQPALGQRTAEPARTGATPHYSVVMTEGHNLLVTDNGANKLYFYTIDKDAPLGSPLKLRASVDLSHVGREEIHIKAINLEKFEPKK